MAATSRAGRRTRAQARREDWLRNGVVSGFIATFAMTIVLVVAYAIALTQGRQDGHLQERWYYALAHNPLTQRTADQLLLAVALNLLMGLLLALVYACWVEPTMSGPGWRKGVLFALLPWILSLIVFLPLMGGGFLGREIGAGPLPILGNLILHLIYGAILGAVYAEAIESGLGDDPVDRANAAASVRGAALGISARLVIGIVVGWLLGPQLEGAGGRTAVTLAGTLTGAASGLAAGSFLGMGGVRRPP